MKALLSLPRTEESIPPAPARTSTPPPPLQPPPKPPARPDFASPSLAPPATPVPSSTLWKTVALVVAALAILGCVASVVVFTLLRSKISTAVMPPTTAPAPTAAATPAAVKTEPSPAPPVSVAPSSPSQVLSIEEAEQYVKDFNRAMERGELDATMAYLDDTVDYYAFGPKDKAALTEILRQYLAAVPVRAFAVSNVKMQPGPKPTVTTLIFDTRYSVRDAAGNPASGRTHTEWDVVRRTDGLKIIRTNWITYPDPPPAR